MNPKQPQARQQLYLSKLTQNGQRLVAPRKKANIQSGDMHPALRKNIIKVNGSVYRYSHGKSSTPQNTTSPRTVHTEPIVLPSIRRKVQEYLERDLKDGTALPNRHHHNETVSIATGVEFLEQKPVALIKSEPEYPGAGDLQPFPKRALPQWTSTRGGTNGKNNKTHRLQPLAKQGHETGHSTHRQDLPTLHQMSSLHAFNSAKIEEFKWWHERMRNLSDEERLLAPPNSALVPTPKQLPAVHEHGLDNPIARPTIASTRKNSKRNTKKQKTTRSTSYGVTSDGKSKHLNQPGMIVIHQTQQSIPRDPHLNHHEEEQRNVQIVQQKNNQNAFKANLIEVHVPDTLTDSSGSLKDLRKRERVKQWLADCEHAVDGTAVNHWFRLPERDSAGSRCSTCEREFTRSKRENTGISARPSVDFTKARSARDDGN
ncbi:uncharacterized protein LOC117301087 [Asterias rubens]|uniref:uncharacterized protein LOC117301087 n=1 Tax=Asterias rubens TaxID=7604 RepID=UPI001455C453|nr:uncharacterized protein LOC117301087 [Asterias rubens]